MITKFRIFDGVKIKPKSACGTEHPDYGWKNITLEGDKMCVYVYELANEMEKGSYW
jgi:hypothetical protein